MGKNVDFPPPFPTCNAVPLFKLPLRNNEQPEVPYCDDSVLTITSPIVENQSKNYGEYVNTFFRK